MNPIFHTDSGEALLAWEGYASKRFFQESNSMTSSPLDAAHFLTVYYGAKEAFITEFLIQRGWRQILGSRTWV